MIWPKRYRRQLLPSPSDLVRFTTQFEAEVAEMSSAQPTLTGKINQQIDRLVRSLLSAQRSPVVVPVPAGAPAPPAVTHRLPAWDEVGAAWIYGHFDGRTFVLQQLAAAG